MAHAYYGCVYYGCAYYGYTYYDRRTYYGMHTAGEMDFVKTASPPNDLINLTNLINST